ncbi:MAG: tripartite tricarboxylate transporter TctB family protein [Hyphomicrobiales bacterium]|nr:tripartite tricarboxylate transporter TctB family protein [Hyphomicrobiales bacterium]
MRFESPGADRIASLVFFALGAAMTYGGYAMDRLEIRQIHPASIPGLVPIILGVALMVCAVLLALQAGNDAEQTDGPPDVSWTDLFCALAFCCVYAAAMVGQMPFGVATALFVTAFSGWFLWPEAGASASVRIRVAVGVILFGIAVSAAISVLFRYAFLVRLP